MSGYYLCVPSKTDRGPLRCADLWLAGLPRTTIPQDGFDPESEESTCSLCFATLEPGTMLRHLPCQHSFHQPCIDEWLCEHDASCPLCRRTFYHLRRPYIIEHMVPARPQTPPEMDADIREARQTFVKWWKELFTLDWFHHEGTSTARKHHLHRQTQHPG
ncbi:hypothetical protein BDV30DRAFT_84688 [Aspergillus minisclerotigenes]|uniref:RING-type domain-containing protein n=1 Tax=Aspergillus minisclerotigenes TaxID=656917 RepID=A0A5N6J896_9EURO|nr:hypothetical protein BDV30DRAFT_84688 [Aspergillus minisclerotigenes]